MSDDFLKGWSQGMTGQTNGLPSQSVMEAMGRDAARNQWNNNNSSPRHTSGSRAADDDDTISVPVTTLLYQAGQKMRFKKLARDYAICLAVIIIGTPLAAHLPSPMDWIIAPFLWAGFIYLFWTMLKTPFYLIAKIGDTLGESKKSPMENATAEPEVKKESEAA